ncbi:hypothetical protein QTG54_016979 [Skeletonema marinoi]|uniref:PHD-type domain-containing protein n=1 Tax=Skeletonema marinoi TaxID=267567 RepID=A0AAD8XRP3_9STRA|nr:hypothetical protein QTG54_016979 [Skeletonema marinoi]
MSEVAKPLTTSAIGTTAENTPNNNEAEQRKQLFESTTTSGMGGSGDTTTSNNEQRNVDAFYQVVWPVLEKEGGWTLVKGTGQQEGLTIFCPPGTTTNIDIPQISTLILSQQNNDKDDDDNNSHSTPKQQVVQPLPSVPELANQQGPWTCVCGVANEEGTIRCEACFGWRENSTAVVVVDKGRNSTTTKKPQYYTKMKHVIGQILKKENEAETKAAEAYETVVSDAMELFGASTSDDEEDDGVNNHYEVPMSPTARMTRQRFSDIAWKENRTHYEKSSSRVGVEYQVDVLPVVGSHTVPEEEVLYDQVWDPEKAQKSGKIDFIDHRVKSSIKEPAYDMLHKRDYQLPGFFAEVSKAPPTDCSHWTAEERAKFRKLVFEKHEDMWQISEALGRPVRECVTYYLGKFKTSKDFRSLRRVMEKARDENPFKYPGEILCDKCGKGGKLVYCDSCDSHYHLTCQDPPLQEVPEGNDWKCNKCVEKKKVADEETDDKTEDTSKSGGEVVEMDTSNAEDADEEVSSFEGKRSDTNDDAGLTMTANTQDESNGTSAEEKKEVVEPAAEGANDANATNDAMSDNSASAAGGEKRPGSVENDDNADTPQHQAKKAKSSTNLEEDTSLTSGVSDEVSGVSEMAPPPQQPPSQQQQQQGGLMRKLHD